MTLDSIRVYCDDQRHEGRVAEIATLTRSVGSWLGSGPRRRRPGYDPNLQHKVPQKAKSPKITRVLGLNQDHGGRMTFVFSCTLCGRSPQLREAVLVPLCDGLSDSDTRSVSLAVLDAYAAKLRSESQDS